MRVEAIRAVPVTLGADEWPLVCAGCGHEGQTGRFDTWTRDFFCPACPPPPREDRKGAGQ